MAKRTIIVEVDERSPFGDEIADEYMSNEERDHLYVPGYSDKRQQYEIALRDGKQPEALPFRLQWVPDRKASGEAWGARIAEYKAEGHFVVDDKKAKEMGLDIDQSPADFGVNKEIRFGDLVLMACPKDVAAARWKRNREAVERLTEERVTGPMRQSIEDYNRRTGDKSDAIFEIETEADRQKKK